MKYPNTLAGGIAFTLDVARGIAAKIPPGGGWAGGMREMVEMLERAMKEPPPDDPVINDDPSQSAPPMIDAVAAEVDA
jgi:hypothetical protein